MSSITSMKLKLILLLSVLANLALAILLLRPPPAPDAVAANTRRISESPGAAAAESRPPAATVGTVTNTVVRTFSWQQVESADYRQYIANLRSIGCPEETIRDIIRADVNLLFESKRKEIRGGARKFEFWKPGNPMAGLMGDSDTLKKLRALEDEKRKVLLDLGIQPDPLNDMLAAVGGNPMDAMFDFLSEAKRTEVMKVMTDFQTRMMEANQAGPTDPEAMLQTQRDMEEALRKMMTPEEFLDYQLRFSITANTLRQQILGFDPTEDEFLKIFKLREAFDQEHSPMGMMNPTDEEMRKRNEATSLLNNQIKEVLGEERFADYTRAQDYTYQQIYQIAKKADLPPTTANEVYAMKSAAELQAAQVNRDAALTPDQRQAALRAIRAETERSMHEALGDQAWNQFNRPNNTWWLRNIARDPN